MICCPDYAVSTTTKTPTTTAKFQLGVGELLGDSYEKVRNHPNINLINEKSCGPIFSNRVVGGQNGNLNLQQKTFHFYLKDLLSKLVVRWR